MKFNVEKFALEKALEYISIAFPIRTTLPILENILLEAVNGKLYLSSTNLEISAKRAISADIQEEGSVTIPAKQFKTSVNTFPESNLEALTVPEGLQINSKRGKYIFMVTASEDFPEIEKIEGGKEIVFDTPSLHRALEKVEFCVAKNDPRAYLNGILFEFEKGKLNLVASDSHKLGLYSFKFPQIKDEMRIIVNPKIYDVVKSCEGEKLKFVIKENLLGIESESGFFVIRLIDESYPEYHNVIPKDTPNILQCAKKDINEALRRLSNFAPPPNYPLKLHLSKTVTLFAQSPDLGQATEDLPGDYKGEELDIGFNTRYLQEIVKSIDGDVVIFKFTESEKACIIAPYDTSEYFYLLMPVRL